MLALNANATQSTSASKFVYAFASAVNVVSITCDSFACVAVTALFCKILFASVLMYRIAASVSVSCPTTAP